jgi:hypothetical protein
MADTDPCDARADALADAIRTACAGYSDPDVASELLVALGECIGRFPLHQRPLLVQGAGAQLRQYVSEIPPLPTDAYPGPDRAA